ncbi:MAG TPA: hypothetical protein VMB80_15785 [Candidatus Acidoferrum sp.]|nr:hypothetical protein [Candidatus Acidoferrum sp.]
MASSDLGQLGTKDGVPVDFNWVLPGLAPLLVPWLAILGLLALKPNRSAVAWLIWLPPGCVLTLTVLPLFALPSGADFMADAIVALALGLAAVWLLAGYLRRQHGFLTFLCVLGALLGFSLMAAMFRVGGTGMDVEVFQAGILLAFGVGVTAAALGLDGWICRHHYRPLALYLWLFVSLSGIWLLLTAPLFLIVLIASGGQIAWSEFFGPVLAAAVVNFAVLLPFLILSSATPFYRNRLKALLHVIPEAPPPLNAPAPEANPKP